MVLAGCQRTPPKPLEVALHRQVLDVAPWPTSTSERLELVSPRDEPGVWFRDVRGEWVPALHAWRVRRDGGGGERDGLVTVTLDGGWLEAQWNHGQLSALQVFGTSWPPGARFDDAGEVEALRYVRRGSAVVDHDVADIVFSGDRLKVIEPSGRVHTRRFEGQQLASDFTDEPRPMSWGDRVWSAGPDGVVATDADGGVVQHPDASLFVVAPEHAVLVEGQTLRLVGPSVDVAFELESEQSLRAVISTESGTGLVALEDEHTVVHFDAARRSWCRVKTEASLQHLVRARLDEDSTLGRSRLLVDAVTSAPAEVVSVVAILSPCAASDGGVRLARTTARVQRPQSFVWEPTRQVLRDDAQPPVELDVACAEAPSWWGSAHDVVTFCRSRRELRVFERFRNPQVLWKVKGRIDAFGVAGDVAWHSVATPKTCATRTITGRVLWTGEDRWVAQSDFHPILFEGLLIVGTGGEVVALDPMTGEAMWRTRVEDAGCIEDATGPDFGTTTVAITGTDTTFASLQLETGALLWTRHMAGLRDGVLCPAWSVVSFSDDEANVVCHEDCASSCACQGLFPSCRRDTGALSAGLVEFSVTGGSNDSCGTDGDDGQPCQLEFVDSLTVGARY